MKKFLRSHALIISIAVVALLCAAFPAFAAIVSDDLKNPPNSLNSFLKLGINVANYILGIVGALTLLMFVYGGVMMIISGGSADKVKKGKDIIIGSVVGLMIVFGSYLIISFVSKTVLDVEFNGSLPEEQKAVEKSGTMCASLPGGYCAKTTGSCASGESSAPSDCAKDEQCCFIEKQGACETAGGQCTVLSACGELVPNQTGLCPQYGDFCCKPKVTQTCEVPRGYCVTTGVCTSFNCGGILKPDLTGCTAGTQQCCSQMCL